MISKANTHASTSNAVARKATRSAPVSWEGRSVRSRVEMRAQPVGPNDVPLAPWTRIRDAAQTDDVKQRFEEAVAGAIGPFAPREAEVRRTASRTVGNERLRPQPRKAFPGMTSVRSGR